MRNLYIGHGFDIYWTYNVECPTIEEHLKMADGSACSPPFIPYHDEILMSDRDRWTLPLALKAHGSSIDCEP